MIKEKKNLSVLTIAATYIGTVVGAGFATGQEVFQFFTLFGWWGVVGLIISTLLFVFFGFFIMKIAREIEAKSHLEVIKFAGGKWLGTIIDWVIIFFLFGAVVIMAAGAGAIVDEQFGFSSLIGSWLMIVVTLITVILGLKNIIKAISFVVPFLLVAVISVSVYSITNNPITPNKLEFLANSPKFTAPNWLIATVLYVSYNMILSVAVLAPLGVLVEKKENLFKGAIWGGIGLGVGALVINIAMIANIPQATLFEIPMVYIAGQISPIIAIGYSAVLLMEVYTTAVGSLYGFVARLIKEEGSQRKIVAIVASIVAFFAAQFGFSNMVRTIFPAVGYAGLLLLGGLTIKSFKGGLRAFRITTPAPAKPLPDKNKENVVNDDKENNKG